MTRRATEWIMAGVCATLTAVVCGTAALLLSHGSGTALPARTSTATTATTTPQAASSYHVEHIANACDLVDLSPFIAFVPLDPRVPVQHKEFTGDRASLSCDAALQDFHRVSLHVYNDRSDPRKLYDSAKGGATTAGRPDRKVGTAAGIGAENFYTVAARGTTSANGYVAIDYEFVVLDADLTITMEVEIGVRNKGLTVDAIAGPVQDQVRAMLSRLHR